MAKFKIGDRVAIRRNSKYYGLSTSNPTDLVIGTVHTPDDGSGDVPVGVKWDNGSFNSYNENDLRLTYKLVGKVGYE